MSPRATPHDADLDGLREDFDALTRATPLSTHPSEDVWVSLASGELAPTEREHLADHVLSCAECARLYRAVAQVRNGAVDFDPGAPHQSGRRILPVWRRASLPRALAASLAIVATGLLAWNLRLQQRTTELQTEVDRARQRAAAPPITAAPPSSPQPQAYVNVPIIDLQPPSRVRGESPSSHVIRLEPDTSLLTLIVNTDGPRGAPDYTLDLLEPSGVTAWTHAGIRPGADGILSVALPAPLVRAGEFTFVLRETGTGRVVGRYPVTFVSR
jgi:hypothetical protein